MGQARIGVLQSEPCSSTMASRRAHTLVEILIAQTLAILCLVILGKVIHSGVRYLLVTEAKAEIQRDCILIARGIAREFAETHDGSFAVGNSTINGNGSARYGVVFGSPRDPATGRVEYDNVGRLLWHKFVAYYLENGQIRRCVAKLDNKLPYPPSVEPLHAFLANHYASKVTGRNVRVFECWKDASSMGLLLQLALPSGYGKDYGVEVQTLVYTRN